MTKENNGKNIGLIVKKSMVNWQPDDKLKEEITKSWGLEKLNERAPDTRSKQAE